MLADIESYLWGVLVVALLSDVVLTGYGLQHGLSEGNPAMRLAVDAAGIVALLGAKLAALGFGVAVRRDLDDRGAVVPLGLAIPWVGAATVNAVLIL
ncbi:putative membrane protein [Halapricum desulfuricans]|uniref:Putative membrane protein n=2 Tax=Halapricum desulfuricans TaxID=2841257 RepID=A0A897NVA6_9EURY|nr:putative membrane protein [Halapricum desulfuricans]